MFVKMMDIENCVTSIMLSKSLRDLGVKQVSYFIWEEAKESFKKDFPDGFKPRINAIAYLSSYDYANGNYPYTITAFAFTVSEILEILPSKINNIHLSIVKLDNIYEVGYGSIHIKFGDESLANALARMLIYLLEKNKLMELSKENK